MVGEQYYLFLMLRDGTKLRVYNKPMTLEAIDRRTVRYKNKKELAREIIKNTHLGISLSDVEEIIVARQPNSKKEEYKLELGPLYEEDANVLNINKIGAEFEIKARDPKFVLKFIEPYSIVKNFKATTGLIFSLIDSKENYYEELQSLVNKISQTYKGCRNIYLSMKFYEKEKERKSKGKIKISTDREPIYHPTEREIKENELLYLREFDRESLDIEDFDDYGELSPFDGSNKSK